VTLGGLERWFSPQGQNFAFLLSCIGLVRPSSSADLKQNKKKAKQNFPSTILRLSIALVPRTPADAPGCRISRTFSVPVGTRETTGATAGSQELAF
jgi:hypothetical protein